MAEHQQEQTEPPSARLSGWRGSVLWLGLVGIAVVELLGHFVVRARVVPDEDWARAADVVRQGYEEGDLVVAAPHWADPVLRRELGDLLSLEDVGRSDMAQYRRLWALSIRGHLPEDAPPSAPDFEQAVGGVTVWRWEVPGDGVLYDFVEHVEDAEVVRLENGVEIPCRWADDRRPLGGGLGRGPITPGARHRCDPRRSWLWVGATLNDDLEMQPRYCIWQHPQGNQPIRATFPDVPLGDRLVLYADIYYEHQRMQEHGPVMVSIKVEGREIGRLTHNDGDGWKRLVAYTRELGERADVAIEVTAPEPHFRTLCWAATTREGAE